MADQFTAYGKLLALAQANKTKAALRAAIVGAGISIVESNPLSGYYRAPAVKDGPLLPIAIWRQDGNLYVMRGGETVALERVWPGCVWSPIPYEWHEAFVDHGKPWPDAAAELPEDEPEKPVEAAEPEIAAETPKAETAQQPETLTPEAEAAQLGRKITTARTAAEKLYATISSDDEAAAAQAARSALNTLSGDADKRRKVLLYPHETKVKEINGAWMPLVKSAKEGADALRGKLSAWETEKLRREQQAAKAAEPPPSVPSASGSVPISHNEQPEQEQTFVAPVTPIATTTIKGATGRAARVTTVNTITVTDQDALYQHVKATAEVKDVLRKIAQRLVDAGSTVPGVEVEKERAVA